MIGMGSLDLSSFLKHTTKYTLCPNYFSNKFNIVTVAKIGKSKERKRMPSLSGRGLLALYLSDESSATLFRSLLRGIIIVKRM